MPIDTSMYTTAQPAPFNPLQAASQGAGVANAIQTNKLLQTQNKAAEIGLSKEQASLAMQHYDNLNKFFAGMVGDPNITHKDVVNRGLDAANAGMFTIAEMSKELPNIPEDAEGIRKWAINHAFQAQSLADQMKLAAGENYNMNAGGNMISGIANSPYRQMQGEPTLVPGAVTPISTTPAEKMARNQGIVNGVATSIPQGVQFDDYGNPKGAAPDMGARPAGWNGADDPGQLPTEGEIISPSGNIGASGDSKKGMAGALQTALTPLEEAEQKNSGNQSVVLQNSADSSPDRKAILGTMEGLIKSGDFNSGPGAESWKNLSAGVQRVFGVKSDSVASQEEFNKLAERLIQEQFKTIGGTGTDTKFGSAISTSPSSTLSNMGNQGIIALMKGNEDVIRIKNKEWRDYKRENGAAANYADFSSEFNKFFDPRVFQAQHMTPEARKKMIGALSKEELKKYRQDYQAAGESGWIN